VPKPHSRLQEPSGFRSSPFQLIRCAWPDKPRRARWFDLRHWLTHRASRHERRGCGSDQEEICVASLWQIDNEGGPKVAPDHNNMSSNRTQIRATNASKSVPSCLRSNVTPRLRLPLPPPILIPSAACRCRHRRRRPEDAGLALRSRPGSDWSKLEWICSHSAGIMINQLLPTADHGATRRSHCHCRLQADHCLLRTPIDAVRFQTIQNCHLIQSICAAQASADCLGCMRGCEFFGLGVDK